MATSIVNPKALSLKCKGCNEMFDSKREPLMLPCLHSFCKPCLEKSMMKEEVVDKKMTCPTCGDRFPLPNNVDLLPVNLQLLNLAKTVAIEKLAKSGNVKCQTCDEKHATTISKSTLMFLCDQCTKVCQRFACEDKFIDLSACKKGGLKIQQTTPSQCLEHKQNHILYCTDCSSLICNICSQTDHSEHKKKTIPQIAAIEKASLRELTNGVDVALNTIDQTLHGIEDMRGKVKVSAKEATKRIDEACDQLIQAVENRRKGLKERCQEIAEGKDDVLSTQMVELEQLKKNLRLALCLAKDAIGNQHHEEVLSIKKQVEDRLIRMKKIYHSKSMELMEDDVINTSFEIESLLNTIGSVGIFSNVPDGSKCSCNCERADKQGVRAIKGKMRKVCITFRDQKESLVNTKRHFQYQLMKVGEDPDEYIPPKVTITQHDDGIATLGFTPDQLGEYELTIMVRNKPIADPYKITVMESRNYKHFQNDPAIEYMNVGGQCFDVAVHDNGTVYATNYSDHTIKVFRPDGSESQIGDSSADGGSLSGPWGITLIGDTIYAVSYGSGSIKMYSTDGRFIKSIGSYGSGNGQFNDPRGICTDGKDRVYVADYSNTRIQVLSSDGTFIKTIPCSYPHDVAIDPDGNIHATRNNSYHIAVYSPHDGRQIETYNLGGNIQGPSVIHIDSMGNRLIACGNGNNMVYIGDSKGNLLSSKQINGGPWAITMDDGMIYIAEHSNKRVSVY